MKEQIKFVLRRRTERGQESEGEREQEERQSV